ncbi:DUF4430 domain-containing protein [Bacillus suaedae]|uniref:DUF4430 domain-containing protein n=1 Tax=Halalkalibacter suaedae TaxID=2822140 RepID=A0A940X090_9BACI|nr:DUF4430 domain-containing protein [Bacillus suaedae]MBP3952470.1 DUF4430 domain-containing protein [Bacillus suaedae]
MKRNINALLSILLVFTLFFGGVQTSAFAADVSEQAVVDTTEVIITLSELTLEEGATAFDALVASVGTENVQYEETDWGKYIKTINGKTAEDPYFWAFYVNDTSAEVGADSYVLAPEDQTIAFKYESWETEEVVTEPSDVVSIELKDLVLEEGATAFDALVASVGTENVQYEETDWGKYIKTINGKTAEDPYFWAFYVNDTSAEVGADSYVLTPEDQTITFKYESWETEEVVTEPSDVVSIELKDLVLEEGATAFDALVASVGTENVQYEETDWGKYIKTINGKTAEDPYFWAFYVNDTSAEVGADSYVLTPEDQTITFKYESWETEVPADDPVKETPDNEGSTQPFDAEQIKSSINSAADYVLAGTVGEWQAVALNKAGKQVPESYLAAVKATFNEVNGEFRNITDYERYTLGILAAGGNPTDFEGYNLVEKIYNGTIEKQGLNGVIYALIALDSYGFEVPADATWTRESIINRLVEKQNSDGGWSWSDGGAADIDTTAAVLTALAPYKNDANVASSVEAGLDYLQNNVNNIDNSSTASQVVIALSALGIDANGTSYTKDDGQSIIEYLLTFQNEDGGFYYMTATESDSFSTDQAFRGVVAYQLFLNGQGSLYNLKSVGVETAPNEDTQEEVVDNSDQKSSNEQGERLPDTATTDYTMLLTGFVLLIMGTFLIRRKKQFQ